VPLSSPCLALARGATARVAAALAPRSSRSPPGLRRRPLRETRVELRAPMPRARAAAQQAQGVVGERVHPSRM
jgi:hypothetical protein